MAEFRASATCFYMTAASGANAPVAIINPIATRQGPFSCRKNPELTAEWLGPRAVI